MKIICLLSITHPYTLPLDLTHGYLMEVRKQHPQSSFPVLTRLDVIPYYARLMNTSLHKPSAEGYKAIYRQHHAEVTTQ